MTDAVREALEAAGVAVWQRMDMLGYETPNVDEAEAVAVAAIAAFLRTLGIVSIGFKVTDNHTTVWGGPDVGEQLAAAVEQASKEAQPLPPPPEGADG